MGEQLEICDRYAWADNAKGIGMLLVIIGHMALPEFAASFIFAFHMPLFVILSGFFFNSDKIKKNLKKLMLCYLNLSVLMTVLNGVELYLSDDFNLKLFLRQFVCILLGGGAPHFRVDAAPAVWFLTSLAVIQIIAFTQERCLKKMKPVVPILCLIAGLVLSRYKDNSFIPYNIDVSLLLYPFFYLGANFKTVIKYIVKLSRIKLLFVAIGGLAVTAAISYVNGFVNIYRCNYGRSIILYYIGSLTGTIMIIAISVLLSNRKFLKPISWLGRNTIVPMCVHQLTIVVLTNLLSRIEFYSQFRYFIRLPLEFALVLLISCTLTIIINKFFPWICAGKRIAARCNEI